MSKDLSVKTKENQGVMPYGEEHDGLGFEKIDGTHLIVPWVKLLGALSEEIQEGPNKVDGAASGQWYNQATCEVMGDVIKVVPVGIEKVFNQYSINNKFYGSYKPDTAPVDEAFAQSGTNKYSTYGTKIKRDDNEGVFFDNLIETINFVGILIDSNDEMDIIATAFSKSKMAPYKQWMTALLSFSDAEKKRTGIKPPIYSHLLKIYSFVDTNTAGQKYPNIKIRPASVGIGGSISPTTIADSLIDASHPYFHKGKTAFKAFEVGRISTAKIVADEQKSPLE